MKAIAHNARNELLTTFGDLQKEFDQSLAQAKQQEQEFNQQCLDFQKKVTSHLTRAKTKFADNNPLAKPIEGFINLIEDTNEQWTKRIAQQDKGVKFREGFNDSLLVFVFGKVKSGKSSLGNYMAWGNTDPTSEQKQATPKALQPIYHSHENTTVKSGDKHKEAENKQEFRVGATEATSSIQSFSLPGLTWVDSPGLHSVNEENGQLAKDFVQQADLILYTMKSDSPGRESDIKEIAQLHRDDKRIIILITGSDEVEEDENEDGDIVKVVVMKKLATRQQQQQAVRQALDNVPELKAIRDNIEMISFSARYAQEHETEKKAFDDSGMGQLFEILQTLAKTDGIKIKQQTPLIGFRTYLNTFIKDLQSYENSLGEFNKPLDELKNNIPPAVNKQTGWVKNQVMALINEKFSELEAYRDDENQIQSKLKNLQESLNKEKQQLIIKAQHHIIQDVMADFSESMLAAMDNSEMLNLPTFEIEKKKETFVKSVRAGTKSRNSGWGALIGGALGAVAGFFSPIPGGAIAGATLGSTLGGMAGNAIGDDASRELGEVTVNVGDNLSDIKLKYHELFEQSITNQMANFQTVLLEKSVAEASEFMGNIKVEIDTLQKQFHQKFTEIDKKLQ